jgi:hypothetical protein
VIQAADKYKVRKFVQEKGLGEYLNDLIGVWDRWEDVDWSKIPERVVLKCNHGARYNIISEHKSLLEEKEVGKKLTNWLNEDFSLYNAEPHYSKIPPKIICEKYLGGDMIDYKFFCFNGEPKFFYVSSGASKGKSDYMSYYYLNGERAPFSRKSYEEYPHDLVDLKDLKKMEKISRILAEEFPFVRVDLFILHGKIYFSELTFTPGGGLMRITPEETLEEWGQLLDISSLTSTKKVENFK